MLTYFSQVLPKNLLWLWKYIREYYRKWIHFLPFTYVGLVHGPEPLPWAMSFYNLSGEVHEHQMMHSVYFPPAVDVERKIFIYEIHFYYLVILAPSKGLSPRRHEFYNFGGGAHEHHTIKCTDVFYDFPSPNCEAEKKIFIFNSYLIHIH